MWTSCITFMSYQDMFVLHSFFSKLTHPAVITWPPSVHHMIQVSNKTFRAAINQSKSIETSQNITCTVTLLPSELFMAPIQLQTVCVRLNDRSAILSLKKDTETSFKNKNTTNKKQRHCPTRKRQVCQEGKLQGSTTERKVWQQIEVKLGV